MTIPNIIAIDGPAASGKSTLAEKIATHLGYLYFDTGVMYRAVTFAAILNHISIQDENAIETLAEKVDIDVQQPTVQDGRKCDVYLNGQDVTWEIRTSEVDANVSPVSVYSGVRKAMTIRQKRIGKRGKVVMVGRDIGTVVCPQAELKIYVDASIEERARRRYNEQLQRGGNTPYDEVLSSMKERDRIDSGRTIAPLKPADDAIIIQSDGMDAEEVFLKVMDLLKTGIRKDK